MQPGWATFTFGIAVGAGTFLIISIASGIQPFNGSSFCGTGQTLLVCTRDWANAFAILTGAIVVAVTVQGQRAEAERHAETIRQSQTTEALRVSRGRLIYEKLKRNQIRLRSDCERAIEANKFYVGSKEIEVWEDIRSRVAEVGASFPDVHYQPLKELFDYSGVVAFNNVGELITAYVRYNQKVMSDKPNQSTIDHAKEINIDRQNVRENAIRIALLIVDAIDDVLEAYRRLARSYRIEIDIH